MIASRLSVEERRGNAPGVARTCAGASTGGFVPQKIWPGESPRPIRPFGLIIRSDQVRGSGHDRRVAPRGTEVSAGLSLTLRDRGIGSVPRIRGLGG